MDKYTYRVKWSEEDQEYVGLCDEFPSLSWLSPTQIEAFKGIIKTVAVVLDDIKSTGEDAPKPINN